MTRHQHLKDSEAFNFGVKVLFAKKPLKKSLLKMAEELSELSTKILQHVNNPNKVKHEDLLEELVDVQMHLDIFELFYNDSVLNRNIVDNKVEKMIMSEDFQKYLDK